MPKTPARPEADNAEKIGKQPPIDLKAYRKVSYSEATVMRIVSDEEVEGCLFMAPLNKGRIGILFYDYTSVDGDGCEPDTAFYHVVDGDGNIIGHGEYWANRVHPPSARYPTFAMLLVKEMEKVVGVQETTPAEAALGTILRQVEMTSKGDCSSWLVGISTDPQRQLRGKLTQYEMQETGSEQMWECTEVDSLVSARKVVAALQSRGMSLDVNSASDRPANADQLFVYAYQTSQLR